MPLAFEKLSASRLLALPADKTVFFFSVGACEDHGFHLPMGLDLQEADRLAVLTAERLERDMPGWTAVIFPRAALGIDTNTTHLALGVRAHVLRDYLVDTSLSLSKHGFRHFVCFSGTMGPKTLTAIEEASRIIRRKSRGIWLFRVLRRNASTAVLVSASSALVPKGDSLRSLFWPDPLEHGGKRDTSVALHLAPDTVDPVHRSAIAQSLSSVKLVRGLKRSRHQLSGYWGKPAEGNGTEGKMLLLDQVDRVFMKLRAVWEGGNPESQFRTWYSVLPLNWSFFKAWVLFSIFVIVTTAWLFLTLQNVAG